MKTSNYIVLSFLIFLFGGIGLLCFGSKYYGGKKSNDNEFLVQEKELTPFSVVVAEPGAYLTLNKSSNFRVAQSYRKDKTAQFAPFEVKNDTLFVYAVQDKKNNEWFIVPDIYCKNLNSVIAKENNNINLKNFPVDSLSIHLNKSDFFWDFDKISSVTIVSKDSNIHIDGDSVEKMNVDLDKTSLFMISKKGVKQITGSLVRNSQFQGDIDGIVQLKKDYSSRLY